jgi:hypothetical protein
MRKEQITESNIEDFSSHRFVYACPYLMTLSARANTSGGIVTPIFSAA